MIRQQILETPAEKLAEAPEVCEGLENRIKQAVLQASDMDSLVKGIKSKRYSYAKISRILMQILTGITKEDIASFEACSCKYAKVLAFSRQGASVLKDATDAACIDVISNVNKYKPKDGIQARMLELDLLASDLYSVICGRPINKYSDNISVPTLTV